MKQNIAGKQRISPVKSVLAIMILGLLIASGCFNPRVDLRIPDIPRIPDVRVEDHRGNDAVVTELGYGTLVIDDGQRILGWWRLDEDNDIYEMHEPPVTQTGQPSGRERTVDTIPGNRVVGFQRR